MERIFKAVICLTCGDAGCILTGNGFLIRNKKARLISCLKQYQENNN
jgi:hypothetical protein